MGSRDPNNAPFLKFIQHIWLCFNSWGNIGWISRGDDCTFGVALIKQSGDPWQMFLKSGRGQGHVTPINFWGLNANSSKMAKGTNFKFGRRSPRDSPDMNPDKCFRKVGVARVT